MPNPTLQAALGQLRLSILLNLSLNALKSSTPLSPASAREAIKYTTKALELDAPDGKIDDESMIKVVLSEKDKAKILYRRAVGYRAVKEEEKAVKDLEKAVEFVKDDGAIINE